MEPPVNRPTYPGSSKNKGVLIRNKGTHPREVFRTPPGRENFGSLSKRLSRDRWSRLAGPFDFRRCVSGYASAVGVGTGSDCVATVRERGRLCLDFVGVEAVSLSTSDLGLERVDRRGLGFAATSPSRLAAADSAVAGSGAASVLCFRPSPNCFASVDRCSEYAGAVRG